MLEMRQFIFIILLLGLTLESGFARTSVSAEYGGGEPDHLHGLRLAIQDYWDKHWRATRHLVLTGYWDYSVAYWHTTDNLQPKEYDDTTIIALAPVFRLQGGSSSAVIRPYAEVSVGASWMSHDNLGHRDLGAKYAFQDLLGFGLVFGKRQEFDLSYHFLHYSNAKLFSPNEGIDIKYLFSLKYTLD